MRAGWTRPGAWRLLLSAVFATLVVAALSVNVAAGGASRPCGESSDRVAKLAEWSVDRQASGDQVTLTVAVKLDEGLAKLLPTPSSKVASLGGFVRFARTDTGEEITRFWLASPDRPVAVGSQYSRLYVFERDAGAQALARTPKQQVSAIVCVATWTYDDGGQVIVN